MLRIHSMQQWFTLSDLAMEEAFFDTPIYREFAGLDAHGRMVYPAYGVTSFRGQQVQFRISRAPSFLLQRRV